MAHTFSLPAPHDPKGMVAKAKKLAAENGAVFTGDEHKGSFSASGVNVDYEIGPGAIQFTVVKKPFIYPNSMVEAKIKEFFTST